MLKRLKRLLILLALLGAVILAAPFIIAEVVDINAYRPEIAAAASRALGMQVSLDGPLRITLLPHIGFVINRPRLSKDNRDVATLRQVRLDIAILPLFSRTVQIKRLSLVEPELSLTSGDKVGLALPNTDETSGLSAPWGFKVAIADLFEFMISNGVLTYADPTRDRSLHIIGADLKLRVPYSKTGDQGNKPKLPVTGTLSISTLKTSYVTLSDIKTSIHGSGSLIRFPDITSVLFGGRGSGQFILDRSGATPSYQLNYELNQFDIGEALATLSEQPIASGSADAGVQLKWNGRGSSAMLRSLNGSASLSGTDFTVNRVDIDKLLEQYKKTQRFNLVDLGAFFLMGPAGTALTKGLDFTNIVNTGAGDTGRIDRLVSRWTIENGVANAEDVAFTTPKNRLALRGRINLASRQIDGVTVALLNKQGCAVFSQKIHGALDNPTIEKPNTFKILTGPVRGVLTAPIKLITGDRCDPFYSGSLPHPSQQTTDQQSGSTNDVQIEDPPFT